MQKKLFLPSIAREALETNWLKLEIQTQNI
jgi:thiazole synthase ThiGH ThiG subunit